MVRGRVARVTGDARRWRVEAEGGRTWFAPTLVLATGAAAAIDGLPSFVTSIVEAIQPIRGQLTQVAVEAPGRVIRAPGVYVSPAAGGVVIGATMEPGRRDLDPDPEEARTRVTAGLALLGVGGEAGATRVGIRGAVADGRPLAGGSGRDRRPPARSGRRGPRPAQVRLISPPEAG